MKVVNTYRLVNEKHAGEPFDGKGSKLRGGRWNGRGKECVYTAGSKSLSILEILVNAKQEALRGSFRLFELRIPETDVLYAKRDNLPENWNELDLPPETQEFGDSWLVSGKTLALAVPSTVAPRDWIYILNPKHKKFGSVVKKAKRLRFEFDARLGD